MPKIQGTGRLQSELRRILEKASAEKRQMTQRQLKRRLEKNLNFEKGMKGHYFSELVKRFERNPKHSHLTGAVYNKRMRIQGINSAIMRTAYHNPNITGEELAEKILEGIKDKKEKERFRKFWHEHPEKAKQFARKARLYLREDFNQGKVSRAKEKRGTNSAAIARTAELGRKKQFVSEGIEKADGLIDALSSGKQNLRTEGQKLVLIRAKRILEDENATDFQRKQAMQILADAKTRLTKSRVIK